MQIIQNHLDKLNIIDRLTKHLCVQFFAIDKSNVYYHTHATYFYFHALSLFISFFSICIMHSAFNLFDFPNYMFTSLLLFFFFTYFFMKGL